MTPKGKDPGSVTNRAMCMMNDEFGVTGWSHSVTYECVDYIDNEDGYEVGVGALVKIILKDGSFHEDVGYGVAKDSKCKGHCIARARRLAANDAFINSVRGFGNQFQDLLSTGKITSYLLEKKLDRQMEFMTDITHDDFNHKLNNKSHNASPATSVKRKLDLSSNGHDNDDEEHEPQVSLYTSSWTHEGPSKGQKASVLKGPNAIVHQPVFEDSSNTAQDLVLQPQSTLSQAKRSPSDKRRRKMRQLELEIAAREKLKTELSMQENSEWSQ